MTRRWWCSLHTDPALGLVSEGHPVLVPEESPDEEAWFLCHHSILQESHLQAEE